MQHSSNQKDEYQVRKITKQPTTLKHFPPLALGK
jgi:hypothetical protein